MYSYSKLPKCRESEVKQRRFRQVYYFFQISKTPSTPLTYNIIKILLLKSCLKIGTVGLDVVLGMYQGFYSCIKRRA